MPTFLSDPPNAVYLTLTLAVIVCGVVWFNRRDRRSLIVFGCVLALTGIVVLLDRLFESPREESVRRVLAMTKAADARDTDAFLSNIADTFQYQGEGGQPKTISRDDLRKSVLWEVLKQYNVHVAAWDFARDDVTQVDANTVEIGFLAKGEADGKQAPMYMRAKFTRQPDGQMKLSGLAAFDPIQRTNERKSLPYFP
jgi:hypothetical protein